MMKKSSDDDEIIEAIRESPLVKKALAARDAKVTLERTGLIARLRQLEAEAEATAPQLAGRLDAALADLKKAEAAMCAAERAVATVLAARQNFTFTFTREHGSIEAELRATSSPLIANFVAEMRSAWDATRRMPLVQTTESTTTKSAATGRTETYLKTNAAAVARRLRAIHETIAGAEELALTVADQSEIPALLGELAAKLPPVI